MKERGALALDAIYEVQRPEISYDMSERDDGIYFAGMVEDDQSGLAASCLVLDEHVGALEVEESPADRGK